MDARRVAISVPYGAIGALLRNELLNNCDIFGACWRRVLACVCVCALTLVYVIL